MPLVTITARSDRDPAALRRLGDAVHTALVAQFNVPADDRFQLYRRLDADAIVADPQYLGIDRRDPVFIEVTLRSGRTTALKQAFYAAVAAGAADQAGIRPQDVFVVLRENGPGDWSFGDGIAQYAGR